MTKMKQTWEALPFPVQVIIGIVLGPFAFAAMVAAAPIVLVSMMMWGAVDAAIAAIDKAVNRW